MATSTRKNLFERKGAPVTYHRELHSTICPCVTPEGFRDPLYHKNWRDHGIISSEALFTGTIFTPGDLRLQYWVFLNAGDFVNLLPVGPPATTFIVTPGGFGFRLNLSSQIVNAPNGFIIYRQETPNTGIPGPIYNLGIQQADAQDKWLDTVPLGTGIIVPTVDIPTCNQLGYVVEANEIVIRAFVQPQWGARRTRQYLLEQFGELRTDDHIGMFPLSWKGVPLTFENWSDAGDEWIDFNGQRFTVVAWTLIPDPRNAGAYHHWECVLRRINTDPPIV